LIGSAEKTERLLADVAAAQRPGAAGFGLAKKTSNLFRDRGQKRAPRVDLSHFNRVIAVDPSAGTVEAEGMATYADLADATLAHATMPAVVPQLKSITLGGAVAGVGIEATSFRQGLVHDTIVAMDVLTGDGRIVRCTADNEHRDLFRGFPNSYGTLGYALRLTARTLPVRRYVHVRHDRHADAARFFGAVEAACADPNADFVDGVVFGPAEHVLTSGRFVDDAPYASDYTYEHVYYRSLRERGFVNRKIERKTTALGGVKSLYSDSYFGEDEFWSIYDRRAYEALKARYDPGRTLGDLYTKCVLRQ
jgi:FAD/FMN-containing dehydrogenase